MHFFEKSEVTTIESNTVYVFYNWTRKKNKDSMVEDRNLNEGNVQMWEKRSPCTCL